MPSAKYLKVKERLVLILCIKNSNKEVIPCLYYYQQARRCLIDLKKSSRYSKYIYSKRSYNLLGLRTVFIIQRQVCRFFIGLIPKRTVVVDPPQTPCFPALKLDFASFKQVVDPSLFPKSLPNFDPLDLFQAVFLSLRTSRGSPLYSVSSLLVPIYYLSRYILSILLGILSNLLQ